MGIFKGVSTLVLYVGSIFLCLLLIARDALVLHYKDELLEKYPELTELFWLKSDSDPFSTGEHFYNGIVLQLILYCCIAIAIGKNHRCLIVPWLIINGILLAILSSCIMTYVFRQGEFDNVSVVCSILAGIDILFWVAILDLHLRIAQSLHVQVISIFVCSRPKTSDSEPTNIDYKNLDKETKENC